jgi:peptidoglycan/xylan/chitin deacetylase (PgdA/CDA1 family)
MPGTLTISLDFELLWGVFDKISKKYRPEYFSNTRRVIPKMLDLFAKDHIQVTWATIGMLFAENQEEWEYYSPELLPSYREKNLSAYHWAKANGLRPEVHFAPDLIREIIQTPFQELGSHTFAHYYTLMRGQSPEQFRQDLRASQTIAREKFRVTLRSLVFPRNHINELYLGICSEEGFDFVRGNPKDWFWQETQHEDQGKKWFRSADCFFPMGKRTSYSKDELNFSSGLPLILPASRFFRHFTNYIPVINSIRLNRVLKEMEQAAIRNEIYHLWWHPHNFGTNPEASLIELRKILNQFDRLREKYGMESLSMENLGKKIAEKQSILTREESFFDLTRIQKP